MAVKVVITATDRAGHQLGHRTVTGPTFDLTYEDQRKAYEELKTEFRDADGSEPYIFTHTTSY